MAEPTIVVDEWRRRLRRKREQLGLSRARAAALTPGVSLSVWRNVETNTCHVQGKVEPYNTSANRLAKMAVAVGLDPVALVEEAARTNPNLDPADILIDVDTAAAEIAADTTVTRLHVTDGDEVSMTRDQWRDAVERVVDLVWTEISEEHEPKEAGEHS